MVIALPYKYCIHAYEVRFKACSPITNWQFLEGLCWKWLVQVPVPRWIVYDLRTTFINHWAGPYSNGIFAEPQRKYNSSMCRRSWEGAAAAALPYCQSQSVWMVNNWTPDCHQLHHALESYKLHVHKCTCSTSWLVRTVTLHMSSADCSCLHSQTRRLWSFTANRPIK